MKSGRSGQLWHGEKDHVGLLVGEVIDVLLELIVGELDQHVENPAHGAPLPFAPSDSESLTRTH